MVDTAHEILETHSKERGVPPTTVALKPNSGKLRIARPCYMRKTTLERIVRTSGKNLEDLGEATKDKKT